MRILTKMLKQTAVWWPLTSVGFDDYGQPIPSTPVEIKVRWEDVGEEFLDVRGTIQMSRARVYVDRDVELGGVLMLGELDSGVDEANPKENDNAWEIRRVEKLPNLRNTEYLRTCYL